MTRVKLCGMQSANDIAIANAFSPDYVGFVFAESKRRVTMQQAQEMKHALQHNIKAVGVFVNQPLDEVAELCRKGIIDMVQLHGDETAAYFRALKERICVPIICVTPVGTQVSEPRFEGDYILYDTASAMRGGVGQTFDWSLLADTNMHRAFLAGGLVPENVGDAIGKLTPFAVDVSSGVETNGKKDAEKIRRFMKAVRGLRNEEAEHE